MHETVPRHVALRKSALLDHLSEAILAVSRKGDIFPVNNAGLKLLALTGRSVKKLKEILFSELSLPRVLEAGDATEIRLRKLNIADHTYLIDSFFDGADLVLLLSDITDVKKMAEDLSQQFTHLLRFKMSMQCITDGIVITDAFERVVFMNATMHDILSSQHKKYEVRTLKDLELLLGIFSENEEGASLPESFCRDEKTGRTFLAEKRKLMLAGERLHGFLICFSAVSALDGQPLKSSLKTAPAPLGDPHCPPAANRRKAEKNSIQSFVGQSKSVLRIKAIIKKVAPSSSTVLLQSESGTGKELLARSLHELSERAGGPFIKLNCASLPESLLEAEVFGYDSGAFTGAKKSGNPGLFEQAHTGTIFLDELGEMSLSLQAKLLRIIQEREVQRIGGQSSKQLDVRIVAATNRDLLQLVKQGRFRSDLLFRLNVVSITIPPLRERKEDIKSLIIYFLRLYAQVFKKNISGVSKEVYYLFMNYDWPGNVRELGNIIEYAFNIIDGNIIESRHLPQYLLDASTAPSGGSRTLDDMVADYAFKTVMDSLEQHKGNKALAALSLGISRAKLYRIIAGRKKPAGL